MKKTSIYLTERELKHLEALARAEGRPRAAIVRDAIAAYPGRSNPDRDFAIDGIAEGPGDSVADVPEHELMNGFGEDAPG
jgi:predicted transcriptional regulator